MYNVLRMYFVYAELPANFQWLSVEFKRANRKHHE
jgi:hypothetical protein